MTPNINAAKQCILKSKKLILEKNNEQVIRDSFTSFLRIIFPDSPSWIERHVEGSEAYVKINKTTHHSAGFVDNLVDLTAIEYESDLTRASKFKTGYNQVKDYCASLLNQGHSEDKIIGILSDTIYWFAYDVIILDTTATSFNRNNIELKEIEQIDLSLGNDVAAQNLIRFLSRYLARIGSRVINAKSIVKDFGFSSKLCKQYIFSISNLVNTAFQDNPKYSDLIQNLWCNFVSYLRNDTFDNTFDNKTYIDEFYILTLAKLICANFIEQEALLSDQSELISILDGKFFENKGFLNLVEYDYFGWLNKSPYIEKLLPVAKAIQADFRAYDFKRNPAEDLFGQLMAQLASRSQRLLLGQEWTPFWLSHQLVFRVIEKIPKNKPLRLLDMCCGSGSMIVAAIEIAKNKIEKENPNLSPIEKMQLLSETITGFDIDPLAVILSKINWLLSLLEWVQNTQGEAIFIPIYHADSLFAVTPLSNNIFEASNFYSLNIAEHSLNLPSYLISPTFQQLFDNLIDRAYRIANFAKNQPLLILEDNVISDVVDDIIHLPKEKITEEQRSEIEIFLKTLTQKLHTMSREGRNGIWTFILRNSYRPGLVAGQFNGLVSNPPWLALSKIANNPYRDVLKRKAEDYSIKPEGASHPHIELATIFLLHSIEKYLSKDAIFGCIAPETILNGHHHNRFRREDYLEGKQPVSFDLEEVWRIEKGTFKNEAIVLFGKKTIQIKSVNPMPCWYIGENLKLSENLYKHQLGNRTAWSTRKLKNKLDNISIYSTGKLFRQGADIMPRTLFFYEVTNHPNKKLSYIQSINPLTSSLAYTIKAAKKHKDFQLSLRSFPNEFIFDVITSNLLTPFHVTTFQKVVLPIKKTRNGIWKMVSPSQIASKNAIVNNTFSQIAGAIQKDGTTEHIFQLIDTRRKLSQQITKEDGFIILTGAGGGKVCCSFLNTKEIEMNKLIFDQTVYWTQVSTLDEALYLSGALNSQAVSKLIEDFQPKGAFGKRHIHKLPFGITPMYQPDSPAHQAVVETTKSLFDEYYVRIQNNPDLQSLLNPNKGTLSRRRKQILLFIKKLPNYAAYEEACQALYGI